jgi:hypothetical protein
MSRWYEVFDNEEVQRRARNRRYILIRGLALTLALSLLLLSYAVGHAAGRLVALVLTAGLWAGTAVWWIRTDSHLRRIVWCVKLSDRKVIGINYARYRTEIDWIKVRSIHLMPSGLRIESSSKADIEIPHLFPDFAALSHRIVEYAEFYGIPVYVDGRPWEQIDVHGLYPYVQGDESGGMSNP